MVRLVFRLTTDFFISPCTDGTEDMIKKERRAGVETIAPYIEKGVVLQGNKEPGAYHLPYENYSVGSHLENFYMYDPFNPESLEGTRQLIDETLDPKGKLGRFGVPLLGGGLQIESVSHVHQRWGPVYDNYDVWLRKIKEMLDPNNLGDWSAYIPPVFP